MHSFNRSPVHDKAVTSLNLIASYPDLFSAPIAQNELTGDQDEEESETVVGDQVEALGQQRLHLRHQDFDRNVELKIE